MAEKKEIKYITYKIKCPNKCEGCGKNTENLYSTKEGFICNKCFKKIYKKKQSYRGKYQPTSTRLKYRVKSIFS